MKTREILGPPTEVYPGVYRGVIEDVVDPEQRKRCRVRVANIHPPEVEAAHLPWAELAATFAGSFFGDLPAFEVGDPVIVMFEGGDRRFPWIFGGILNYDGGLPPLPAEQTSDYERTQKRWTRIDRVGNKIEMSPLEDELHISIETPDGSRVRLNGKDGTIEIVAEGRVQIVAPAVQLSAEQVTAEIGTLVADVADEATLRCSGVTNIRAADEINIGEYLPPATGATPPVAETSSTINIKAASTVKIESAGLIDVDAAGEIQIDGQSKITIKATSDLTIETDANLIAIVQGDATIDVEGDLQALVAGNALIDVEGTTTIETTQKLLVNGSAEIEVNAVSSFKLTADGAFDVEGSVNMTIDAGANLSVTCGAILTMRATSQIVLEAPIVTLDADSLVEVLGGSTARVDGGLILIG